VRFARLAQRRAIVAPQLPAAVKAVANACNKKRRKLSATLASAASNEERSRNRPTRK
jgi:hypothetical protein